MSATELNVEAAMKIVDSIREGAYPSGVITTGPTGVTYTPPDLSLAYAALAPIVAEAWAFAECGRVDEALAALTRARQVVAMVESPPMILGARDDGNWSC